MEPLPTSKRRLIDELKRRPPATAAELADVLEITTTAVRQHLGGLEQVGLVARIEPVGSGERGRPAARFALTDLANDLFPDRHRDLAVELIDAIRTSGGTELLDTVVGARTETQRARYAVAIGEPTETPVAVRVDRLAALRSGEGYVADVTLGEVDGELVLTEHHCPICDAATACQSLCRDELALFADVLGTDVTVERISHLLAGDARCAYRIAPQR